MVRRLPVRGADLVLMAQHARWREGASNNTTFVVHCDGPLDPARLRRALDRFLDVCPWPAARLGRPFPWGKLRWTAGLRTTLVAPPVRQHTVGTDADVHEAVEAELNAGIDPRHDAPVRFSVLDVGGTRGVLIATWFHPLMDPRGGQNLLADLACLDADERASVDPDAVTTLPGSASSLSFRERGRLARRSLDYMRTLAPIPPVSPGSRLTTPGPARFLRASFPETDGDARAARGTREISWRLAVVGKAVADLWRRSGLPDVPFLLPIAVDMRPKGEPGPTFGNMLAFHFARFRLADTADVQALARTLRQQMADAVRDGQIDANAVAMEFLHYRPLSTMLRALPWTAGGEIFSFNCADPGDVPPALDRFLGRRVVNAYHVPCVLPRPGVGVFFNRCAGVNNVVVSWVEGAMVADEASRLIGIVAEEMGWSAQT